MFSLIFILAPILAVILTWITFAILAHHHNPSRQFPLTHFKDPKE